MTRKFARISVLMAALSPAAAAAQKPAADRDVVILATTTSLAETGLLDTLAPLFRRATGYELRAVAVGSGQALRMAERGDADVVLAHSPAAEEAFISAGHGLFAREVARNWFTIVGPPGDPAGVRDAPDAARALDRVREAGAVFVSRGDSSGTHARELGLWRESGGLRRWPGYLETGQGMSLTLLVADERRGYTLTDRATWGSLRPRLDLVPLRGEEPALLNVYRVIELNPAGRPRLNVEGGRAFADFMVSDEVQGLLGSYGFSPAREPRSRSSPGN